MNKNNMRYTAIRAARSYLREQGVASPTVKDAHKALDDLNRIQPDTDAAAWWRQANKSQLAKFRTEWGKGKAK